MTMELCWLSAAELRAAYAAGDLSPREVCSAVLERVESLNPTLRAFLNRMGEAGEKRAAAAEAEWSRRRRQGETRGAPPLLGVPVSVKDTVDVAGAPTTMGSLLATSSPAAADELFIERLRASGAVLIGKTNTSEFGLAAHTTNRLGDPCVNPWNPTRTAGGSSGGAAAACAAGLGPVHHGSDGGGSVRIPAAYCGVVGLKPTGRRVARRVRGAGMSQFEVDGALARTVRDAALLVSAMSGSDDRDPAPYSGDTPDLQRWVVAGALRDLRLSAPPSVATEAVTAGVARAVDALRHAGAAVTDETPVTPDPSTVLTTLASAGTVVDYGELAARNMEKLSEYARRSLSRGASLTGPDVALAYAELDRLVRAMEKFFERRDGLVLPTTATTAPSNRLRVPQRGAESVNPWLISTLHTPLANLIHAPAIAVPMGFDEEGLPVSVQIVARPGDEATVLRCAAVLEKARPGSDRRPAAVATVASDP